MPELDAATVDYRDVFRLRQPNGLELHPVESFNTIGNFFKTDRGNPGGENFHGSGIFGGSLDILVDLSAIELGAVEDRKTTAILAESAEADNTNFHPDLDLAGTQDFPSHRRRSGVFKPHHRGERFCVIALLRPASVQWLRATISRVPRPTLVAPTRESAHRLVPLIDKPTVRFLHILSQAIEQTSQRICRVALLPHHLAAGDLL